MPRLKLFEQSSCFFIIKRAFSFYNSLYYAFFIFPIFCKYTA